MSNILKEKYLVSIEFRYTDVPIGEYDTQYKSKTVTIGVYDEFDDACKYGNELMEKLESRFQLHEFPDGRKASKERFSKNGGCFGGKHDLITNLAYLRTPFQFYAKITTLKYYAVDGVISDVLTATKRYKDYKSSISE